VFFLDFYLYRTYRDLAEPKGSRLRGHQLDFNFAKA
jgi:hypothetical protein